MDSQCPGCLGQAVVTSRLLCAIVMIVGSPRRHEGVPFVNIVSLRSRSIKLRQWKHKLDYYGVVFAHLATGCGINAKDPSGLDSDRWIPHSRYCENPARAKALAGFSRYLSTGFTDLNQAPRGLSLYNVPALIPIMAWRRPGDKPLSEPMMVNLLTHICVTRPQWVNLHGEPTGDWWISFTKGQ